jgi:peptide/nickel transport system permease protein
MTTPGGPTEPIPYLLDLLRHLVLPVTAVALGLIGGYSILMRSAIIFPNAMLPMVTLIAINIGYVIAGAITAEIVFNWPGIGTLTVFALDARDYPLLQGIFLLVSVSVVMANFAADIIYGFLDPRVRA